LKEAKPKLNIPETMKREIIKIDLDLCNGCGVCVPNCHEGALQIIDGKARLISDLMCDGLGACIGHCPEGAITMETREAEPYNETMVIAEMVKNGKNTVIAHLQHLKEHGETEFLKEGVAYLQAHKDELTFDVKEVMQKVHHNIKNHEQHQQGAACGCPSAQTLTFAPKANATNTVSGDINSELQQWPVQLHLVNPNAPYYRGADVVIAADCTAFAIGDFHRKFLKGKSLAIACPKLDSGLDIYVEKITAMIEDAKVNTITVMIMEVPCCSGLLQMTRMAAKNATRKVPIKSLVVSIRGEVISEQWV